jgi:hypothetical protein
MGQRLKPRNPKIRPLHEDVTFYHMIKEGSAELQLGETALQELLKHDRSKDYRNLAI